MVLEYGKTGAAIHAGGAERLSEASHARLSVALRLEDGRLVGWFDQGAINPDTIHRFPW